LHNNTEEWIEPSKFIPERFDNNSPYSRTPSGDKRDPSSYSPFASGKRSCFGKTFAEIAPKVVCSMINDKFDLSLAEAKFTEFVPCYMVSVEVPPSVNFILKHRDKEN